MFKAAINHIRHVFHVHQSLEHEAEKLATRSPKWAALEHAFKKTHSTCAACGSGVHLQVHHCSPFHLHPELELVESNLISMCMSENECHLRIGHGDNFKMWNPTVIADAAESLAHPERRDAVAARAKLQRQS